MQNRAVLAFNWQVEQEFKELILFLSCVRAEVEGRENGQPEDEFAEKLIKFAQGECTPEERQHVCELLRRNPSWLRWLAEQVKMGREGNGPSARNA